jgi:hypothetical protein
MSSSLYVPIQPAQAPDPNGFLFDLELQFLAMVRRQPTVSQWHRRFAQRSVPQALRYLTLLGIASVALGSFVLFAAAHGGS